MRATPESILSYSPDAIFKKTIVDVVVVVNVGDGKDYALNPVASRIWELVDGERSLAQIAQALSEEFEAPYEQVLEDTLALAGWLDERGLVLF